VPTLTCLDAVQKVQANVMEDCNLSYVINALRSPEARNRVSILKVLRRSDRADEEVLPHIEELLNDLTPCMIDVKPIRFSEIRYLAGQALETQRRLLGIDKPVNFSGFVQQMIAGYLIGLAKESNIQYSNFQEEYPEIFEKLRAMEKLPIADETGYGCPEALSYE
jgi:hypothetical protein